MAKSRHQLVISQNKPPRRWLSRQGTNWWGVQGNNTSINASTLQVLASTKRSSRQFSKKKMCFKVDCKQCHKSTWSGCGKHVASVYNSIEKGKHCTCRPWPGVPMASSGSSSASTNLNTGTSKDHMVTVSILAAGSMIIALVSNLFAAKAWWWWRIWSCQGGKSSLSLKF